MARPMPFPHHTSPEPDLGMINVMPSHDNLHFSLVKSGANIWLIFNICGNVHTLKE
jgi:hypothetical protein